jgi:tRNA dimethylallyltransferase
LGEEARAASVEAGFVEHDGPIVIVAGPTGSGKSACALAIAEEFRGTVINADSMQVYRDLDIVTARPDAAATARVPHRLYGFLDAAEVCSVGRWRGLALAEIAAARDAGRLPILAGGTGLYLGALLNGLAEVPAIDPGIREEARARHAELGGAAFHALLGERDPVGAARLAPSDTQRLLRAWEVVTATGLSLADWQARQDPAPRWHAASVVLMPPRDGLYKTLDRRFLAMIDGGATEEVARLTARCLPPHFPALKAVGVAEIAAWLDGSRTREDALAAAQQATRRYAKRQFTWLRHRFERSVHLRKLQIDAQFSESLLPEIFSFIRQFLLTEAP